MIFSSRSPYASLSNTQIKLSLISWGHFILCPLEPLDISQVSFQVLFPIPSLVYYWCSLIILFCLLNILFLEMQEEQDDDLILLTWFIVF